MAIDDALPPGNYHATFLDGELQLMTTGPRHENLKSVIALLVGAAAEAVGADLRSMGNPTYRRAALNRGFEPDHVFYLGLERRSLDGLPPERMPPPDLALEVEVSDTVLDRLPLYAAVGVPEVWRIDGERGLTFLLLKGGPGGEYADATESAVLPGVSADLVWEAGLTVPEAGDFAYMQAAAEFFRDRLGD